LRAFQIPLAEQTIVIYALLVGDAGEEGQLDWLAVEEATGTTLLSALSNRCKCATAK